MKSIAEQIKEQEAAQLAALIEYVGGKSQLARFLGVRPEVVTNWLQRGRISATCAITAEEFTGGVFTAAMMRPDVTEWRKSANGK